jgi:hypothetical protein
MVVAAGVGGPPYGCDAALDETGAGGAVLLWIICASVVVGAGGAPVVATDGGAELPGTAEVATTGGTVATAGLV